MSNPIRYRLMFLLRAAVLLMSVFTFWRLLFFWINAPTGNYPFVKVLPAFLLGLRMDAAVSAYLLAPLFLVFLVSDFTSVKSIAFRLILWAASLIITLVVLGNMVIYHFWGVLLNYRAVSYLKDPAEAAASVTFLQALLLLTIALLLVFFTGRLLTKRLKPDTAMAPITRKQRGIVMLVWFAIILTAARGGWQQLPLNESNVYYSSDTFLNHTAVNPVWHLFNDIKMAGITNENPFRRMSDENAQRVVNALNPKREEPSKALLVSKQPNIVIIILESFSAHLVEAMGGEKGITPGLDSLIHHGLLFSNIYSSGFRTDQGIVSVLNGWPATPYHSIMRSTDKSEQLPSMPKLLKSKGYHTSFYYGGAPNFSNLGAYLNTQQFDRIITSSAFPENQEHGRWGYHDDVVLSRQLLDVNKDRSPFFSVIMTLSNHEPFDVPGPRFNSGTDESDKFRNSAHYTDDALRKYFAKARETSWFKNTLFIVVADHGHKLPNKLSIYYPPSRWIPMVFAGPALSGNYCNKREQKMGGHHDLAATLLPELELDAGTFKWSKNLLSPLAASYAYIPMEDELVWNLPDGWFFYSYDMDKVTRRSFGGLKKETAEQLRQAMATMQEHYDTYLRY